MINFDITVEQLLTLKPVREKPVETGSDSPILSEHLKPSEPENQKNIYLINTRLWLNQLSEKYQSRITVDTVPEEEWGKLFEQHDYFWFMGIYQPSEFSRQHAIKYSYEYLAALPDLRPDRDVVASPFAVKDYSPAAAIASDWGSWDRMVDKLHAHGKKVIIDFVPNHTAVDHAWAKQHPEYYVQGNEDQFRANPNLFVPVRADNGKVCYLAHGRDPNFPEWADTLQLNYADPKVQEQMVRILNDLSEHCDGVRCDVSMLITPGTFTRTWGWLLSGEEKDYLWRHDFWAKAIPEIKKRTAESRGEDFTFIAEAYWDQEHLGKWFDYIYNHDLYKHVKRVVKEGESARSLMDNLVGHLFRNGDKNRHCKDLLYTENHDENRATAELGPEAAMAATAVIALLPNTMLLINQGQKEGYKIRPPMQIGRYPNERADKHVEAFYEKLLAFKNSLLCQQGQWELVHLSNQENVIALEVTGPDPNVGAVVCINFCGDESKGFVPQIRHDSYVQVQSLNRNEKINPDQERRQGLYFELQPWETQIFMFSRKKTGM